jgi:hypothetical protein
MTGSWVTSHPILARTSAYLLVRINITHSNFSIHLKHLMNCCTSLQPSVDTSRIFLAPLLHPGATQSSYIICYRSISNLQTLLITQSYKHRITQNPLISFGSVKLYWKTSSSNLFYLYAHHREMSNHLFGYMFRKEDFSSHPPYLFFTPLKSNFTPQSSVYVNRTFF